MAKQVESDVRRTHGLPNVLQCANGISVGLGRTVTSAEHILASGVWFGSQEFEDDFSK